MKTLRPLRSRVNIGVPDDNNRLEFQVKARKARSPCPKDALYRGEGVTLVHPAKGVFNPPFLFPGVSRFCFVCFVWFPSGSAGIIGCDVMRSTKFDVIAVDELDTMHLEADLTDAFVSANAETTRTRPGVRVHYSSLGERGAGPWGPAPPPGKGRG